MDKPVWGDDFIYSGSQSVKVSCHPCIYGSRAHCNLVGDQPLFYIDDTPDMEDDDNVLFTEDIGLFPSDEKFLAKMKAKLAAYEKTAETLSKIDHIMPEDDFDHHVLDAYNKVLTLDDVQEYGFKSDLFRSYWGVMEQNTIEIMLTAKVETSSYHRETRSIALNPYLDVKTACQYLIRSMRTAWNHLEGALLNPLAFQPEESVLMNRLLAADLDVAVTAFLWDQKLAGDEEAWARAMMSSQYDLCAAYAMEAMTDFRSIKSGLACRATFEKWFLSGRCKSYDRQIIQTMMGGHTDIEIDNTNASRLVAMDMIASLGRRPNGVNYLSSIVTQIMSDALYGEIRDRSNANFLWFITFERRMDQAEKDMQKGQEEKVTDNIYTLPNNPNGGSSPKKAKGEMASLFFLDHFRAG